MKVLGRRARMCRFLLAVPFVFVLSGVGWSADAFIRMERLINAAFWAWCAKA